MKYKTVPPTISVNQYTGVTGIKKRTLFNLIKSGEVESMKIGHSRRILTKPLLEHIDADTLLAYLNATA